MHTAAKFSQSLSHRGLCDDMSLDCDSFCTRSGAIHLPSADYPLSLATFLMADPRHLTP
jgi:hypothetical protein